MLRLRVQELAKQRGYKNLSEFQRGARLPMSTARRVWFSTSDGSPHGPPLKFFSFDLLEQLAEFFGVEAGDLLETVDDSGKHTH